MTGQCRNCASERETKALNCLVCNQSFVRAVRLEGSAGFVEAAISTDIGKAILRRLIGDDSKFSSTLQYRLEFGPDSRWRVHSVAEARNPTFVNGGPIPEEGHALADGDELSLAGKVGQVRVRLVMDAMS